MLEKSKQENAEEKTLYGKFKCYCDSETAKKTKEVEGLAGDIARLESSIEKIKGSTGSLSTECAQLRADMMENEQARDKAQGMRDKEHENFEIGRAHV